jgi:hypothetical protein
MSMKNHWDIHSIIGSLAIYCICIYIYILYVYQRDVLGDMASYHGIWQFTSETADVAPGVEKSIARLQNTVQGGAPSSKFVYNLH